MIEFLPWSKSVLEHSCGVLKNGHFPILDIELGGMCNLRCIYCDSPDRTKKFTAREYIYKIIDLAEIRWLFICGLGEPTFAENKNELINLLSLCKKNNVKCSMFTNMIDFDDELFSYIESDTLYVMFKLDSFHADVIKRIYGDKSLNADDLANKIKKLLSLVKVKDNCTNVCASIVPTTLNYEELIPIVDFCKRNNIFPLLGDLENSGKGRDVYSRLKLSDNQLAEIKKHMGDSYKIPICPSVLCGIHILHDGTIAVDEFSGLSCHWFWLEEPSVHELNAIWDYPSYNDVEQAVLAYRKSKLELVRQKAATTVPLVFGGCGGDVKELLDIYLLQNDNSMEK